MKKAIVYAIWLKEVCELGIYGAYAYDDKLYYTDSASDMKALYKLFKKSQKLL